VGLLNYMALVKHNNNSISAVTSMASLSTGSMTLISEQTASSSSSIDFTSGIDSTYPIYKFEFIALHPSASAPAFNFQTDTGTNTNYNQTVTTTNFRAYHYENDSGAGLGYKTADDLAQSTNNVLLIDGVGNANDSCTSGNLFLFNPSSSVFVKHFIANFIDDCDSSIANHYFTAGYFNTTTALTRTRFQMSTGNIDSGTIKLYGIKDS